MVKVSNVYSYCWILTTLANNLYWILKNIPNEMENLSHLSFNKSFRLNTAVYYQAS